MLDPHLRFHEQCILLLLSLQLGVVIARYFCPCQHLQHLPWLHYRLVAMHHVQESSCHLPQLLVRDKTGQLFQSYHNSMSWQYEHPALQQLCMQGKGIVHPYQAPFLQQWRPKQVIHIFQPHSLACQGLQWFDIHILIQQRWTLPKH